MAHRATLSPHKQLLLAKRTTKHARDVLRFLRNNPMFGTPASRFRVQHDHHWLLKFGLRVEHRALARIKIASRPTVDSCLDTLIRREGGYNPHKWNGGYVGAWNDPAHGGTHGGSGAYGGPQALPGNKMASAGADWADNIWTQIKWMKGYVMKYGGSCGALDHSTRYGWY